MSSPKLLAYKAVIEFAEMLSDVLKNPDAIKEAGKAYAEGFSMSDSEKMQREESLKAIEYAKSASEDLKRRTTEFFTAVDTIKKQHQEKEDFLNGIKADAQNKLDESTILHGKIEDYKKESEAILAEAKTTMKAASLAQKDNAKILADIEKKEEALSERESAVSIREKSMDEKEQKINTIFGSVK